MNGVKDPFPVGEGVVNIALSDSTVSALCMGVLYPSDEKKGTLSVMDLRTRKSQVLLDSLQRPVFGI